MLKWLAELWCDWAHGGGTIEVDLSRKVIRWRCDVCGRDLAEAHRRAHKS